MMQDSLGPIETSSTVSLREYGDVLRRRRAIILQTFVIVLVAGVLVTLFQPPVYRATARLLTEPPQYTINSVNASDPLADLFRANPGYSVPTQVELLQTPEIRDEVTKKLSAPELPLITVGALEGTQIIEVSAEGSNPDLVASVPNTLLDVYVDNVGNASKKELDNALKIASENAAAAQRDLNKSEDDLRRFKQQNNIPELERSRDEQIGKVQGLGGAYDQVETELRVLNATIAATKSAMQKAGSVRNDVLAREADPYLQGIDARIADLDIQKTSLTTGEQGLGPENATIVRLNAERSALLKRRTVLEQQFVKRNQRSNPEYLQFATALLNYDIRAAELSTRASDLASQLAVAKTRLANFPQWERKYYAMQRDYESAKGTYNLFSSKQGDLLLRAKTKRATSQVMQRAVAPTVPIRPKKAQGIVLAGLLGLFLGLCLALLQELFDDRINTPEEAERVLRIPNLGHVPMIEEEGLRLIKDISTFSPLMESYRSLRTNINFAAVGAPIRSMVVTSSVPAEGKSTTAANLAMAMALDNKRVIIVDADLRRPSQHKLFKIESSPGLTDILVGTHTIEEVMRDTSVPGVSVIPAGSPPPNPAELLGSAAMGHLLATLEASADIVLFDSPPALAVADSVVLASRTNGVLLVIGYGETRKTNTRKAMDVLARANAHVLGTVLNRMDGPSSGYYYGKYYVPATDRVSANGTKNGNGTEGASKALPVSDAKNERMDAALTTNDLKDTNDK